MFEVRETGNPEVPLYFGEGLRRSLGNAAGCGGGGQMGCAGLSFAWMFLCVAILLGSFAKATANFLISKPLLKYK